jgi:hypothetical protein
MERNFEANINDRVLESVDRINFVVDRNYCCTVLDTVKNPRVSQEAANILSGLATVSFSTVTLLHEVMLPAICLEYGV